MMASEMLVTGMGISRSCSLLGIPRRSYYRWISEPNEHHPERTSRIPEYVTSRIINLSMERTTYGYRRIWALLRNAGIMLNQKTVMGIMRSHGLLLKPHARRKKTSTVLTRSSHPDEVWETDLTYIWTEKEGMTYLFNVKDIFTKEWVGYFYSRTCNRFDALMSIENAILRHPERYSEGRVNDTVLRCDNGGQYTSHHFKDNARLLGFTMEFIEKSTPQQNGDVESFHGSLKADYVWTDEFMDFNDAEKKIGKAFNDYNNVRPHSSVDYLPPSVFRERFLNDPAFRKSYMDKLRKREESMKLGRGLRAHKEKTESEVKSEYA